MVPQRLEIFFSIALGNKLLFGSHDWSNRQSKTVHRKKINTKQNFQHKKAMVVFSIKSGGEDGFLYEASVQDMNEDVITGLVIFFFSVYFLKFSV